MEFCYSYVCDTLVLGIIKQTPAPPEADVLLDENGDPILLEDGSEIELE